MRELRRTVVLLVICSFTLAALLGVVALLGGAGIGVGQARVLCTTVVVGIESVAMLCYLALAGHRLAAVGVAGAVVSVVATGLALRLVWGDWDGDLWRPFAAAVVVAATLAQTSLLIALARRRELLAVLVPTLALAGLLAALVCGAIVTDDAGDGFVKLVGVLAILDVLGTLVLIALAVFTGRTPARTTADISDDALARLVDEAAAAGITAEELAGRLRAHGRHR